MKKEQYISELQEAFESISGIHVDNVMRAAKVLRAGELHVQRGKYYAAKGKTERRKQVKKYNPCAIKGLKMIARSISDLQPNL